MQQQQWVRRRRRRRKMQPSKNAMQNLNEKKKKIHKTMQQKHCNISYNNPTPNNAIKRNPTKTKTKPKKQHRTLKLYLWQWEYGWVLSLLGWCSKGFWVLGVRVFWGKKKKNTKKQQQSFSISAKTPILSTCKSINLFYLCKTHNSGNAREKQRSIRVWMWSKLWDSL